MLKVEATVQRGHMATNSGQNVLEAEKRTCQYLENEAR